MPDKADLYGQTAAALTQENLADQGYISPAANDAANAVIEKQEKFFSDTEIVYTYEGAEWKIS